MFSPIFLAVLCVHLSEEARILGYFSFPSVSHQVVFQSIWRELSLRGHEVLVLTPNPLNDKTLTNLTEIDLGSTYEIIEKHPLQELISKNLSQEKLYEAIFELLRLIFIHQTQHPRVQALINDDRQKFDLVIAEAFYPGAFAFAARFRAPVIGVASLNFFPNSHRAIGNPCHPVLNPNMFFLNIYENMAVWDRARSAYFAVWFAWWYEYRVLPRVDRDVKEIFGEKMPFIGDVERNMSLIFLNVNPIVHAVRADVPAVVEMGFMHLKPKTPLPKDIQELLDEAQEGIIYLSLGSNVKSANLSQELKTKITAAIAELPYTVLWKWESDFLPNKPKNVITRKWLPQQDLLGHPNIKAFVTQGGLQSLEEAIVNGVPIVGIPFIADQPMNVQKMVHLGAGLSVDPSGFSSDDLKNAIIEVASNSTTYRSKMNELRRIALDQPMTGLERAVWWSEYVIRHKGAKHLRSPSADIPLVQYLLLDVVAIVLGFVIVCALVTWKILTLLIRKKDKCKIN